MKFARWIFLIAGIYGVVVLTPGLLMPPQGAPEFYYGFIGSALVWQLAFFIVARDPVGFRALMPICMLEKLAFFVTCLALRFTGQMDASPIFIGAMIDGLWLLLFVWAWFATRSAHARS